MGVGFAVAAALGSAICVAVGSTLQHTAAGRGRRAGWTPTGQLARFARLQLRQPLWWLAAAVQAGALALHATALSLGSLTLVQPLLASVVLLALPINHLAHRSRMTGGELAGALAATVGLAGFVAMAAPRSDPTPIPAAELVLPAVAAVAAVAGCLLVARRGAAHHAAVALGVGSGVAFTLQAALLQSVTATLLHDPWAILATPTLYGLILAGGAGVALTQLAFRAGPMASALPAIVTVTPVASVILDGTLGHGGTPTSAAAMLIETASLVAVMLAVGLLAHRPGPTAGASTPSTTPPGTVTGQKAPR